MTSCAECIEMLDRAAEQLELMKRHLLAGSGQSCPDGFLEASYEVTRCLKNVVATALGPRRPPSWRAFERVGVSPTSPQREARRCDAPTAGPASLDRLQAMRSKFFR